MAKKPSKRKVSQRSRANGQHRARSRNSQWEHDPEAYDRDLQLNQRINSLFNDMILAFVTSQIQHGPVYTTEEIATNFGGQSGGLTEGLTK